MKHMKQIIAHVDVSKLHNALLRNPQLWDEHGVRRISPQSPHRDMSDIIVRYNDMSNLKSDSHEDRLEWSREHESVWYPCIAVIPEVKDVVFQVMSLVRGERLGGVLITKLPPGKQCYPHIDKSWHSEYYDTYAVQIAGNGQQAFHFDDGEIVTYPGDVAWFDNIHNHWVTNDSNEDRITMVISIKSHRYERT
jgi:hypothetical protein